MYLQKSALRESALRRDISRDIAGLQVTDPISPLDLPSEAPLSILAATIQLLDKDAS